MRYTGLGGGGDTKWANVRSSDLEMKGKWDQEFLDLNLPLDDELPVRKECISEFPVVCFRLRGMRVNLYADSSDLVENSGR